MRSRWFAQTRLGQITGLDGFRPFTAFSKVRSKARHRNDREDVSLDTQLLQFVIDRASLTSLARPPLLDRGGGGGGDDGSSGFLGGRSLYEARIPGKTNRKVCKICEACE